MLEFVESQRIRHNLETTAATDVHYNVSLISSIFPNKIKK